MSVIKTHTGIVITRDGEKRMKLHSTERLDLPDVVNPTTKRLVTVGCAANMRRRLLLDSIRPIKQVATREQN